MEAIRVLGKVYEGSTSDQVEILEMLLQTNHSAPKILTLFRSKPELGFRDCLIYEVSKKAGLSPLGTFDRDLSKIDGAVKI